MTKPRVHEEETPEGRNTEGHSLRGVTDRTALRRQGREGRVGGEGNSIAQLPRVAVT